VNLAVCYDPDTDVISSTQRRTDKKNISNIANGYLHFYCAEQWRCNLLHIFTWIFTVRTAIVICCVLLSPAIAVKSYSSGPSLQYRLKATYFAWEFRELSRFSRQVPY